VALALAGCGGDSEDQATGEDEVGSVAALAQCRDWNDRDEDERAQTIEDIREQINLKDSAVQTPELSDSAAYRILDTICKRPSAAGFRLYKLYARADSFALFAED
jgi:hypothetical protein